MVPERVARRGARKGSQKAAAETIDTPYQPRVSAAQQQASRKGKLYTSKPQADIVRGVRTTTFLTAHTNFAGNPALSSGMVREFPHGMEPTQLRNLMGAEVRTKALNADLRAARKVKYDSDLRAMHEAESVVAAAKAVRGDGSRLRLGNMQVVRAHPLVGCR